MVMEPNELLIDGLDPEAPTVVLAHGAGAPMDSPFMESMARGLVEAGLRTVRFEFPYMRVRRDTGRRGRPDPGPVLAGVWQEVVEHLGGGPQLVIGGKSMGGRIASMVADALGVRGLVCLGYPFHPPGKAGVLRVAHLRDLRTPTLIVQGTRDRLGTREEIEGYDLSGAIRVAYLADGDHSFRPRVKSGRTEQHNLDEAVDVVSKFVHSL